MKISKFWTEPRYCIVLGLKPMGKPITSKNLCFGQNQGLDGPRTQTYGETNYFKNSKFWTEPRSCMVLGLKPMGKPTTSKNLSFRQN